MVKQAVIMVTMSLTYEVWGSLIVLRKFLLMRRPS
jgi:hypothetical protein